MVRLKVSMKPAIMLICLFVALPVFSQEKLKKGPFFLKPPATVNFSPVHSVCNNARGIPQSFYTQHFGFFCRQELKMQRIHVPVTFRLGSMDHCNELEQKPGYR
jgi:hypothetical protein